MVSEPRQRLNQRLRQNWMEKTRNKIDTTTTMAGQDLSSTVYHTGLDDSELTNLSWLVGLDLDCIAVDSTTTTTTTGSGWKEEARQRADDWQKRPRKPTHTYSAMITMAINETPEKQMTVAGIYAWIRTNFSYYRHTSATWKNSVRHCLSTNRRFQRVSQSRDKFGKRFWRIVPDDISISSSRKADENESFDRRPLANKARRNDGGIREAIRVVGRCETIESTADSHGSHSPPPESAYESSFDSSSDLDSPSSSSSASSGLLSPRWSSDSRLDDILNDLESNPPLGSAGLEPGTAAAVASSFCFEEQVSEENNHAAVVCQRLMNLDSDFLISDVTGNDDWILTDISRATSCGRSFAEFLQNAGQEEEFHADLLDSDLNLKSIISEF